MYMNDERWDAVGPSMDHTQEHTARSLWYEVPCRRRGSTTVRLCCFQRGIAPLDSNIFGTLFDHLHGKAEKGGKECVARFAGHSFATMGSYCCLSQLWQCIVSAFCHACILGSKERRRWRQWTVALAKAIFSPCARREDIFCFAEMEAPERCTRTSRKSSFCKMVKSFCETNSGYSPLFQQIALCFS